MNIGAFDLCFVTVHTLPHCQYLSGLSYQHFLLPDTPSLLRKCSLSYSWPPGPHPSMLGIPPLFCFFPLPEQPELCLMAVPFWCHSRVSQLLGDTAVRQASFKRGFVFFWGGVSLAQTHLVTKHDLNWQKPFLSTFSFVHLMWIFMFVAKIFVFILECWF